MPHGLKTSSTATCRSERRPRWPSRKGKKPHDQASADQVQEAVTLSSVAAFPLGSMCIDEHQTFLLLFLGCIARVMHLCQCYPPGLNSNLERMSVSVVACPRNQVPHIVKLNRMSAGERLAFLAQAFVGRAIPPVGLFIACWCLRLTSKFIRNNAFDPSCRRWSDSVWSSPDVVASHNFYPRIIASGSSAMLQAEAI